MRMFITALLLAAMLPMYAAAQTHTPVSPENSTYQRVLFERLGKARLLGAQDTPLLSPSASEQKRRSFGPLFQAIARSDLRRAKMHPPRSGHLDDLDSKTGATPLTWAAQTAHPGMAAWLLDLGASLEAADGQGYTALTTAIRSGKYETARLLLDRGADPDRAIPLGMRPLQLACGPKGSLAMAQLLITRGANPHLADNNGWTPLAMAAKCGNADVVDYLLQLGVHPDGAPSARFTPLHWAAVENRLRSAARLLDAGADPTRKSVGGHTPLSWAASKEMLALLTQGTPIE